MIVSRAVTENLTKSSWIRRMFEEGARLKQERGADKVFDFTLGNPEIEPPAAVVAAPRGVLESTAPHLHAYMPTAGHVKVREAVAGRLRASTGLPYTAGHVLMTVGAGAALNTVLKALLDPGDEVLTVAPFFAEYTFYAENHGGKLVVVPPKADLTPDIAKLEAAITSRTRAILVNSPNNPSGAIYPRSTFVEIEKPLKLEDVAKSLGDEKAQTRARPLDERVHRDRRAVDDGADLARVDGVLVGQAREPDADGLGKLVRGRRDFQTEQLAPLRVEEGEVGEGPADIDPEPVPRHRCRDCAVSAASGQDVTRARPRSPAPPRARR